MDNNKQHLTCNLAEMAAIEAVADMVPDKYLLILDPEGDRRKDKAWAVYLDKDELPKHIEIKKYLEFAQIMNRRKLHCFDELRKKRIEEEQKDIPKEENKNVGPETK